MENEKRKKYVLVIPDGAADVYREAGKSPLATARIPACDFLAREGASGLMQTLYEDLPKESIVAQLGMLGWDPHVYYPHGRASCELLALEGVRLGRHDLAFRANFVRMEQGILASYNADYIRDEQARPLVARLNEALREEFPQFELYHNTDFRNTLVVRNAGADPRRMRCPEPHESHGVRFDVRNLIRGEDAASDAVAERINRYLLSVSELLEGEAANMVFPWSASKTLELPPFNEHTGYDGRGAVVGNMDFLQGIAKAGGLDFFRRGNGRPDTDFRGKGATTLELLDSGYDFVVCHINAPDEASHMGDLRLKIETLEQLDRWVVRPLVEYFETRPDALGGMMVVPDHYTNHERVSAKLKRVETHSPHPVPFALWNGRERDAATAFSEDDALVGKYAGVPVNHLDLLRLLGVMRSRRYQAAVS
jgi:2,3-bisphosphoglycerate-independent phosphoglycerate mutase